MVGARCGACGCAVAPGGFVVERVLGESNRSRSYLARSPRGEYVVLEELFVPPGPSADLWAAFDHEAALLEKIDHPAVPPYLAHFAEGEGMPLRLYVAQRHVEGTSLLAELETRRYSEAEVIGIGLEVLEVLEALHQRSPPLFHRDLRPGNLVRRPDGGLSLIDFGSPRDANARAQGTTLSGTVGYAPIEQLAGVVSAASDVYGLAATLLHLVSRKAPWELAERIAPRSLKALGLSGQFSRWLTRALDPRPANRFQTAAVARAALATPQGRPGKRALALSAAVGAGCLLLSVGVLRAKAHSTAPRVHPLLVDELCPEGATLQGDESTQSCVLLVAGKPERFGVSVTSAVPPRGDGSDWAQGSRLSNQINTELAKGNKADQTLIAKLQQQLSDLQRRPERRVERVAHYENDVLNGSFERFDYLGGTLESGRYVAGLREGAWQGNEGTGVYLKGKREGVWTSRLGDAKELVATETWHEDEREGPAVQYSVTRGPDGQSTWKRSESNYHRGKPDGLFTEFRSDGTKETSGQFTNGARVGVWTTWDAAGKQKVAEDRHDAGERVVEHTTFSPSGGSEHWVEGKDGRWSMVEYDGEHRKLRELAPCEGSQDPECWTLVSWWPSGKLQSKAGMRSLVSLFGHGLRWATIDIEITSRLNGTFEEWFEDGSRHTERHFLAGVRSGEAKTWWPDGKLRIVESFKNGQRVGPFKEYFQNGRLKTIGDYDAPTGKGNLVEYPEPGLVEEKPKTRR